MTETYYLYHIPGKKIGVTRDLNKRVTQVQGYKPGEYEVLESSKDIDYISKKELELQKSFGYRIDHKPYKNLYKMKINVTEQTTTFPCPLNKLKGQLMDNPGLNWETPFGKIALDIELIHWVVKNAHESMYNSNRCYVYNKALWEAFTKINSLESLQKHITKSNITEPDCYVPDNFGAARAVAHFDLIRAWANERGLYEKGNTITQYVKLQEEAGELAKALLENNHDEINDAIGDMVVVLTNLAHIHGTDIEECIAQAYNEIKSRKGKMINGTFVKDIEVHEEKVL